MSKILSGIRVVDMSTYIAGPVCGKILADWGAEVIKLESIKGDPVRLLGANMGMPVADNENPLYCLMNANKKALAIEQRKPEAQEIVDKLLSSADVFLTNYRNEALAKMGLSYEEFKTKYPKVVFAHVLGYGEEGPHASRPGFDFSTYYARSGFMADLAEKNGSPTSTVPGLGDNQLGAYLAGGIAAALFNRTRTGVGDYVSCSLYHAAIYGFNVAVAASHYGKLYPTDRSMPAIPTANCYKCKDGEWFMFASASYPIYFPKACRLLGLDDYAENPDYCTIKGMLQRKGEIVKMLEAKFMEKTSVEWDEIFAAAGIPGDRLYHFTDVVKDEQAWANDFLHKMEFDNGHTATLPTTPLKFASLGEPEFIHPTGVGKDNEAVMKLLGYDETTIKALREAGVLA